MYYLKRRTTHGLVGGQGGVASLGLRYIAVEKRFLNACYNT
jgi:hypothetical protein